MNRLRSSHASVVAVIVGASFALVACRVEPKFTTAPVVSGLDHPWDIAFTPGQNMLFTERSGRINILFGGQRRVLATPADVRPMSEGGMLGMAVDPHFASNRRIYTCFLSNASGGLDLRVVRWRINDAVTGLEQ
ncbi:MAG: PQQ-dependent sugar dehydrogenase, partial [Actinomycetota bacterium]|nr:PQQ-dependent sugar dehydrogenase [Actinomycetota bacterium]